MDKDLPSVCLSALDEVRFGIRTAKAPHVTLETLPSVIDFCHANDVVFLIARVPSTDIRAVQSMERQGFFLTDTLVYYVRDLKKKSGYSPGGNALVRPIRYGEEEGVKLAAAEAFRGYFGHYHADERLERAKCDETYVSWAVRSSISKEVADEVLVAELEGTIVGFATLRMNTPEEGEGILFGVAPAAQGFGIYSSFIIHGMEWCLSKGARRMVVSTQITNIAVQKVWTRMGFEPLYACYTFHKWFDRP